MELRYGPAAEAQAHSASHQNMAWRGDRVKPAGCDKVADAATRARDVDRSVVHWKLRIPDDLPQMLIRILEVASVTTPEGLLRLFHDERTGG